MKPRYIVEAESLIGTHEVSGKAASKDILSLWADAGLEPTSTDEDPWCAAFVGGTLVRANKPGTKSALARSYLQYGDKLRKPEQYCIGVMKRGNSTWQGHVGYVMKFDDSHIWLLGGNQSNAVSIQKYPRSQFLGFVKPKEEEQDKPKREVAKDSRRLQVQSWWQRTLIGLGFGGTVSWQTLSAVKNFVTDNAGWMILGGLACAWCVSLLLSSMSFNEYRQGRYLPSRQWR